MKTVTKIHGGKYYQAERIIALMPPPTTWHLYREPFAGGLSVLLELDLTAFKTKDSKAGLSETANDIDGDLTNFWEVLRSPETFPEFQRRCVFTPFSEKAFRDAQHELTSPDPITRAVAFFVLVRQSQTGHRREFSVPTQDRNRRMMHADVSAWLSAVEALPAVHERLKRVEIRNMDAMKFIRRYDHPEAVFYCDPPYMHETRCNGGGEYAHEMSNDQHAELLATLSKLKGRFLLSGYRSQLYDDVASKHGWNRADYPVKNNVSRKATKDVKIESVWTNFGTRITPPVTPR